MIEVQMSVAETTEQYSMEVAENIEFKGIYVTYYSGTTVPSSSLGEDGDIYAVIYNG